jgi:integrase
VARVNLTEARIRALQPDPTGRQRRELRDALVPGLIVRCAARRKVFALHCRFPGAKAPTRRVIGEVGALTIEQARDIARDWVQQIGRGVDPAAEAQRRADAARRARDAEQQREELSFANVAADYLRRRVAGQRRAAAVARIVNNVLVPAFGDRLITAIARREVVKLVEQIDDRGAPVYAAAAFGTLRSMFNWAINRGSYELETSPCDRVKVSDLVSRTKQPRQRVLSDAELIAFHKATGRLGYPWQQLFRLLLLTGCRRGEVAGARWSEFDLSNKLFTVPPARFKSNSTHLVPLSGDAMAVVDGLPHFKHGDCLFSFTFGRTPALVLHDAKQRLDTLMLRYLKAMARHRGDDPAAVTLPPWVVHDLRRTVRTRLAALEINDSVAEMVIGHGRKGLQRVYDQHSYEPQMRRALAAWAAALRGIVTPTDRLCRAARPVAAAGLRA